MKTNYNLNCYDSWENVYRKRSISSLPWVKNEAHPELISLLSTLDIRNKRALDVGCGTGVISKYLSDIGCHTTGIDISESAINYCINNNHSSSSLIFYKTNSITFTSKLKFHLIIDFLHLHHIQKTDIQKYINKLTQLAERESYLILAYFSQKDQSCPNSLERDSSFSTGKVYYYDRNMIGYLLSPFFNLRLSKTIVVGSYSHTYLANLDVYRGGVNYL